MKTQKMIRVVSQLYMLFCIVSLGYVSVLSLISPQSTMELVSTPLPNTDAISSIRGIYGGVGLVLVLLLIYLLVNAIEKGLLFLLLFWSAYAISRFITILVDGALGPFGTQWLVIETVFGIIAIVLLVLFRYSRPGSVVVSE